MSVELLQILSTVFFALAGLFFLISVALFFVLDVVRLVGDVTGYTARKAIEDIRKGNEISGDKAYKPSPVNKARGKLTDKISPSGQLERRSDTMGVATGTAKLTAEELMSQSIDASGTNAVPDETTVLTDEITETTVLSTETTETTVLSQSANETTILGQASNVSTISNVFSLDIEMSFIGSSELIE